MSETPPNQPENEGEDDPPEPPADGDGSDVFAAGLPVEIPEELVELIPEAKRQAAALIIKTMSSRFHRGPLPPADELLKYNDAVPDGAERIVSMAEREQGHRHRMDERSIELQQSALDGDVGIKKRGQWFAFGGMVAILIVVALIAYMGHPTQAAIIAGSALATVVALFLGNKFMPRKGKADEDNDED